MDDKELLKKSPALALSKRLMQGMPLQDAIDSFGQAAQAVHGNRQASLGKRQPLLVDRYLASPMVENYLLLRKKQELVRDHLHAAKRFVFDDTATRYVAEMIRDVPEALAMAQEFALPPFPVMYVEIPNFKLFYETVSGTLADEDSDNRIGYLYVWPKVYVLADGAGKNATIPPMLGPLEYHLNKPFDPKEEVKVCDILEISRLTLDTFMWGSSVTKMNQEWIRSFRANHSFKMMCSTDFIEQHAPQMFDRLFQGSAADLRNIVAMLLFLNQTNGLRYENEVLPHRAMLRNRPRTFLSHSVVTLKLNPVPMIKKRVLGAMSSRWVREHEVRGHFCVSKKARESCLGLHDWQEYGPNQWKCKGCGGLKWWRKNCRRGSKDKGQVRATYEVKA